MPSRDISRTFTVPRFLRTAGLAFVATASVVGACTKTLPSEEPLGLGPTAVLDLEREAQHKKHTQAERNSMKGQEDAQAVEVTGEPEDAGISDAAGDADADMDADDAQPARQADAGDASTSAFPFAGEYVGDDVMVIRLMGMPEQTQRDDKARTRVAQTKASEITVSIINSATGDVICSFDADVKNDGATVKAGEECFGEEGRMRGVITSGQIKLDHDRLILDLETQLEVAGRALGNLDYHFDGERK